VALESLAGMAIAHPVVQQYLQQTIDSKPSAIVTPMLRTLLSTISATHDDDVQ
jgi:hypothetical protein